MKTSLLASVMVLTTAAAFSQNSAESNQLSFDGTKNHSQISGVSKKLIFGGSTAQISETSNVLYYGVSKVIKVPAAPSQLASNMKERQQETPPPVVVEQKKVEEPTRQVASQETAVQTSTSSVPASVPPTVPTLVAAPTVVPAAVPAVTQTLSAPAPPAIKSAPMLGGEFTMAVPRFVALVIGVSKYKYAEGGGPRNLANAANDAERLYNTLITKYNFDTTNSRLLKNANRQQILDELDRLTAETNEKDNVLIFYAGHGFYDSHTEFGYWLPADSKTTTRSEWIANSTIKDYMSAVKSKHTLLIADACFGGSIFKSRAVDAVTFLKVHELYKDPSKRAITSGNLSEVPDKSVFLDQLLKKLNENEDDYLPSQKLFNRIYEPVSNNATEPQFGVIQGAGDEGGDFIFIKKN